VKKLGGKDSILTNIVTRALPRDGDIEFSFTLVRISIALSKYSPSPIPDMPARYSYIATAGGTFGSWGPYLPLSSFIYLFRFALFLLFMC